MTETDSNASLICRKVGIATMTLWVSSLFLSFEIVSGNGSPGSLVEIHNEGSGFFALILGWLSVLWCWSVAWIANIPFLVYTRYLLKGSMPPAIPVYITVILAFSILLPLHIETTANYVRGYAVYMWLASFIVLGGYVGYVKATNIFD